MSQITNPFDRQQQDEREITTALERKPSVQIHANFAARVAAHAAAMPPMQHREPISYGRLAATVCAAVAVAAMFVLAAQAKASFASLAFDVELLLLVQLVGIAWWLTISKVRHES